MLYSTKLLAVAALAVLTAAPVQAQGGSGGRGKRRPDADKAQSAPKLTKEREDAYKNALKGIPDGKPVTDPWKGAR